MATTSRRLKRTARLLDLAQLGNAHWLFGNIYEAVVKIPERLAAERRDTAPGSGRGSPSVLAPGSPLRYYAPVAPITLAATAAAVSTGWEIEGARCWLALTASCSLAGMAISGYLIRTVNLRVMFADTQPPPAERDALIGRWYRLNVIRVATAAGALLAANRAGAMITERNGRLAVR
ncbi:hypothetical protein A5756_17030 [Mycobacterium sp. 852002-53434_SCH5985345]|uniref:DUF1772 domain-containing protein n=1 Tax=unclassified Mycobacterium TaxID=2642494 RepID=UPI0007FBDB72|nr:MULTISPECIES: DUF1772 domain-containing protein [unclassified Mycobacterium]OBF53168.1 hypothetical protein A5756_17030 [Mycobacterium sp. 852002-53434_SCH5985345]OBF72972.1 hypothetical protein A5750_16290 [Mycobacterium sp. 852002-51613_SCH5001154]OBF97992.1 hypothetical protein A5773_09630 [Mycobacterium sp. 852014-52450_SCH5900713]